MAANRRIQIAAACALLLFASGCAQRAPATSEQPSTIESLSLEQVREAFRDRSFDLEADEEGKPPQLSRLVVTELHRDTVEVTDVRLRENGEEDCRRTSFSTTWSEWKARLNPFRAVETVGEESLTLPSGIFDCVKALLRKPGSVTTVWLARELAGFPVKTVETRSNRTRTTILQSTRPASLKGSLRACADGIGERVRQ